MKIETIKLTHIKPNPNNPRIIKGHQLDKLKKSLQEFPEMLEVRPLVIDENNVVIGGNMRLRALEELGYDEVPVLRFEYLSEEKKREFVVKDNLNYGEWNWDTMKQDWNLDVVNDWGLELPTWIQDDDLEPELDIDILGDKLQTYLDEQVKRITLFFSNAEYVETIHKLQTLMDDRNIPTTTEAFIYLLNKYLEEKK